MLAGILLVVAIVVFFLLYQILLPALSLGFFGSFLFIGLFIIALCSIAGFWLKNKGDDYNPWLPGISAIVIVAALLIGGIGSTAMFHSQKMQTQIGEVSEHSFTEDIVPLDNSQIPTVNAELAQKQGEKELGKISSLGSQVKLGEFTIQEVNGELIFVAPLEHTGLFKWGSNGSTPGYVVVSATNPNDVKLVDELDGKKIALKYLESAFFGDDLKRHIRNSGYRTEGLTDFSFELDDTGRPFYAVTTYQNTALWGTPEATGIITCDVQTGEVVKYAIDDVPEWIDRIQPEAFIDNQINNWGDLVHGILNFSDKDKIKKTPDMITVYNEGECYYYTGLTSVGSDEATVGFIMVNTRTKEAVRFSMSGATEDAAMRSAEGLVQDMGYMATEPVPLNLNGIPTYFMTLKDNEGLIKQYAMVNIKNYSIVALGSTIAEVKRDYMSKMTSTGNSVAFSDEAFSYNITGVVTRISANVENGNTYYYIILDNDSSKLFMAPYSISEELPITREGDTVDISYIDDSNMTIDIAKFDNVKFSQEVSEAQQDKNDQTPPVIGNEDNKITEVDPEKNAEAWDNLTDEEKAKLLEELNKQ